MQLPPLAAVLLASLFALPAARAATVPAGTRLHPKQEIVRDVGTEPATLDPNKAEGVPEHTLLIDLFEGLTSTDVKGNVVPGVAEKWVSRDKDKTWIFTLRRNAKWSDGSPVTADDFVFAFRRQVDPKTASPYAWFPGKAAHILNAAAISEGKLPAAKLGVTAIDAHTLKIQLDQPTAFLPKTLTHTSMLPVPRKIVEKWGDRWVEAGKLVGNGAYRMTERVVNERIVMVRNPYYWNDAKTVLNKVSWLMLVQPSAAYQRYRAGGVDMTSNGGVPVDQIKKIRAEIPGELKLWPQLGTYFYEFNTKVKPFDDWRVRKALSLAIDRDIMTRLVTNTGETPAYSLTPPVTNGYQPIVHDFERLSQAQRLEMAKKLLAQAGYGPNKPLTFQLLYNTMDLHKKIALASNAMWRKLGPIKIELVNQEWKTFLDSCIRGDFVVARASWVADYNEASTMLDLFTTGHGQNHGKYSNPAYDKLLQQAKLAPDDASRIRFYQQAETILAHDTPALFFYFYSNKMLIKPWVRGYGPDPMGYAMSKELYIAAH
ncbi:peptide ABC transporter substrate-binding protein [Niveibacterium terrae]|uniref:peptide ABC transporter substrate-binding protein n=1 Tax=Niveibacterium terrae TaxID=3373598 RepID=UPI003A8E4B46